MNLNNRIIPFKTTSELISSEKVNPPGRQFSPLSVCLLTISLLTSEVFLPMCSKKQNKTKAMHYLLGLRTQFHLGREKNIALRALLLLSLSVLHKCGGIILTDFLSHLVFSQSLCPSFYPNKQLGILCLLL